MKISKFVSIPLCLASAMVLYACESNVDDAGVTVRAASHATTSTTATAPEAATQPAAPQAASSQEKKASDGNTSLRKPEADDANRVLSPATVKGGAETQAELRQQSAAAAPAVKAEPAIVDFGDVATGDTGESKIKLTNTSDKPVTIVRANASCGCTTMRLQPNTVLPPGESIEVDVKMSVGIRPGPVAGKQVTFVIEGQPSNIIVPLKANAVSFVELEPMELSPDETPEGGRLKLRAVDGTPFRIMSMQPALISEFSDEPAVEHELVFDWNKYRELGIRHRPTIYLDHPKCQSVTPIIKWNPEEIRQAVAKEREANLKNRQAIKQPSVQSAQQATDPDAVLVAMIKEGRNSEVLARLQAGLSLEYRDNTGATLLSLAARHGNVELIQSLLAAGAELEATDNVSRTPLMWAAQSKNVEAVRVLLDAGASPTIRDSIGNSALAWAAGVGDPETVRELIDAGSDVEIIGAITGWTPLIWAAGFGDPGSIEPLLEAKANIEAADFLQGATPLIHAARTGKVEGVKILLKHGAKIDTRDRNGNTALLAAAGNPGGTLEKIKVLVEAGADIHAKDNRGLNALDLARKRTDAQAKQIEEYLESLMANADGAESKE